MKKSPTVLFDILAEEDSDKAKEKLQRIRQSLDIAPDALPKGHRGDNAEGTVDATFSEQGSVIAASSLPDSRATISAPKNATTIFRIPDNHDSSPSPLSAAYAEEEKESAALDEHLRSISPETILKELLGDLFIHPSALKQEECLGEGAYATVHKASLNHGQSGISQVVAVKKLKPEVLKGARDLKDFLMEANLMRKLKNRYILTVVGIGASDLDSLESVRQSVYLVMEAMEGGSMKKAVIRQMTSRGTPDYDHHDALRWCQHLASAMYYLHSVCKPMIIHRDLKLDNCLLAYDAGGLRHCKLADFGLHKRARHSAAKPGELLPDASVHYSLRSGGGSSREGTLYDRSYYGGKSVHGRSVHARSVHRGNLGLQKQVLLQQQQQLAVASGSGAVSLLQKPSSSSLLLQQQHNKPSTLETNQDGMDASSILSPCPSFLDQQRLAPDNSKQCSLVRTAAHGSSSALSALKASGYVPPPVNPGTSGIPYVPSKASLEAEEKAAPGGDDLKLIAFMKMPSKRHQSTQNLRLLKEVLHLKDEEDNDSSVVALSNQTARDLDNSIIPASDHRGPSSSDYNPSQHSLLKEGLLAGAETKSVRHSVDQIVLLPGMVEPQEASLHRKMLALMALDQAAHIEHQGEQELARQRTLLIPEDDGAAAAATDHHLEGVVPPARQEAAAFDETGRGSQDLGAAGVALAAGTLLSIKEDCHDDSSRPVTPEQVKAELTTSKSGSRGVLSNEGLASAGTISTSQGLASAGTISTSQGMGSTCDAVSTASDSHCISAGGGGITDTITRPTSFQQSPPSTSTQQQNPTRSSWSGRRDSSGAAAGAAGVSASPFHFNRSGSGRKQKQPAGAVTASAASPSNSGRDTSVVLRGLRSSGMFAGEKGAAAAADVTDWKFADATQQVGSLMYMAPELFTGSVYNEKVDVFSFAIIAHELFTGRLMAMKGEFMAGGPDAVTAYCMRRAEGEREPIPARVPGPIKDLIIKCWDQDPARRPSFQEVLSELQAIEESRVLDQEANAGKSSGCGCSVM